MKTLVATLLIMCVSLTGAIAGPLKVFKGVYKPLLMDSISLSNPSGGVFSESKKYTRVYDSITLKVSGSGRVKGSANVYYMDFWGNITTDKTTVKFDGRISKFEKNPYVNIKTANLRVKGTDGAKVSGQAIWEKSSFGLSIKRNLVFEMKRGHFNGSGLLVYMRK